MSTRTNTDSLPFQPSSVLQRIAAREPHAFDDFLRHYRPLLLYLIRKSLGTGWRTRSECDDALQDICLAIWESADRFDPARGSEKTFIALLARRRLIDRYYRGRNRLTTSELATEAIDQYSDEGDSRACEITPLLESVEKALATLNPENRYLLELAILHDKSSAEISRATGLGVNTVKSRIHRSLNRLRSVVTAERVAA